MFTARLSPTLLVCSVALVALVSSAEGQTERVDLIVDDPRPIAAAVLSLIRRHPVVITYEDPRYTFRDDIQDVTERVRRNPAPEKGRILVPRGGHLQTSYEIASDTDAPVSLVTALTDLVEAKNANPVGGRFAVRQNGDVFHIIPLEARDEHGTWVKQVSILDTPITFSSGDMDGYDLIEAILKTLAEASGASILGLSAARYTNDFRRYTGSVDATKEPAREVLLRTLQSISPRLTYAMTYDPSGRYYVFNAVATAEAQGLDLPQEFVVPRPGEPSPTGPRRAVGNHPPL